MSEYKLIFFAQKKDVVWRILLSKIAYTVKNPAKKLDLNSLCSNYACCQQEQNLPPKENLRSQMRHQVEVKLLPCVLSSILNIKVSSKDHSS